MNQLSLILSFGFVPSWSVILVEVVVTSVLRIHCLLYFLAYFLFPDLGDKQRLPSLTSTSQCRGAGGTSRMRGSKTLPPIIMISVPVKQIKHLGLYRFERIAPPVGAVMNILLYCCLEKLHGRRRLDTPLALSCHIPWS